MLEALYSFPWKYAVFGSVGGIVRFFYSDDPKVALTAVQDVLLAAILSIVLAPAVSESYNLSQNWAYVFCFALGLYGVDLVRFAIAVGKDIWSEKFRQWLIQRVYNLMDKFPSGK